MEKEKTAELEKRQVIFALVMVSLVVISGIVLLLIGGKGNKSSVPLLSDDGSYKVTPSVEDVIPKIDHEYVESGSLDKGSSVIGLSVEESYLLAKREFGKISGFGDLKVFGERFGTSENLQNIGKMESAGSFIDLDVIAGEMVRGMVPASDISIEGKSGTSDRAELSIKNRSTSEVGTATMIFERGGWRFGSEIWKK